jgi:hypothetical protein
MRPGLAAFAALLAARWAAAEAGRVGICSKRSLDRAFSGRLHRLRERRLIRGGDSCRQADLGSFAILTRREKNQRAIIESLRARSWRQGRKSSASAISTEAMTPTSSSRWDAAGGRGPEGHSRRPPPGPPSTGAPRIAPSASTSALSRSSRSRRLTRYVVPVAIESRYRTATTTRQAKASSAGVLLGYRRSFSSSASPPSSRGERCRGRKRLAELMARRGDRTSRRFTTSTPGRSSQRLSGSTGRIPESSGCPTWVSWSPALYMTALEASSRDPDDWKSYFAFHF